MRGGPAVSDESLFREVDEEVRQEQLKKLWGRYGNVITAAVLAVVAGVAAFKGWQYWQVKQAEAAGEAFFTASRLINEGKHEDAQKILTGISHQGYALLARFRLAADQASQGRADEAIKSYEAIAADTAAPPAMRELARIRAGYLLADRLSPGDLDAKLGDLGRDGNPWRNQVREILAIAAWRTGEYLTADKQVNAILADRDAPAGLRQRAQMLAELLLPRLDKPAAP
jgi:hypothetical protein